jgi:hypothetical protein
MSSSSSVDRWNSYGIIIRQIVKSSPSIKRAPVQINYFNDIRMMNMNELKKLKRILIITIENYKKGGKLLSRLTYVNNRIRLLSSFIESS